jgi:fructose-1,6-bisphosphatase/inositol monophosphatase family enzyme
MDFLQIFTDIARDVERNIEKTDSTEVGKNLKGDTTLNFDLVAEDTVFKGLTKAITGFEMLGEERGVRIQGKPEYIFVVDPVDGSYNRSRRVGMYSFSIAGMRHKENPSLKDIEFGFVKNLVTGEIYYAEKGKGALYNGKEAHTSEITDLSKSLVNLDLTIYTNPPSFETVYPLLSKIRRIRCIGSAAYSTAVVASGQAEAYVDLRERLTVENYAASQLIVKEAGGVVSDAEGNELDVTLDITKPKSVLFSCNKTIQEQILDSLK